ncbi:MAG: Fic/DOC family protein [Alphaproteobacteria bacterium]|nr:Fic/DOC family protein [Alphaproteobacteria bacterium]
MTNKNTKKTNLPNLENKIEIYQSKDGAIEFNADIKNHNIWASQGQIVNLFKIDQSVASRHIKNIFKDGEVDESNMQKMHIANSDKPVTFYSLDVILAVGYRTNSKTAIEFRKWATERLKDYLVKGFAVNEKRVKEYQKNLTELQKTIKLIQDSVDSKQLSNQESKGFLDIITNYANSFVLLNQFDSDNLHLSKLDKNITYEISYDEACKAITELKKQLIKKKEATTLFGNQKDQSFAGILGNITQSFGGNYLYKTIEEQASHLLYFVIKNHPFSDGNKRIGAFLFIWFLNKNKHSLKKSGELKINDNGLVALALLVASSNPKEKALMIKLIINLINEQ